MVRTRGNTPQAQVAPVAQMRTTRSTRSQSTEPLPKLTARPGRLGGPLPTASTTRNDTRSSSGVVKKVATKDLSIVEEDEASDSEDEPADVVKTPPRKANPRISISGTTVRSSSSEEEPDHLLLERAPHLCNAAATVLNLLTVPSTRRKTTNIEDIVRQVKNPTSTTAKLLWEQAQNFDSNFKRFGDDFLDPQRIMESIFEPNSPPPPDSKSWGLMELINSANLAYFGNWVANAQRDEPEVFEFLKTLDEICPLPFLSSLVEGLKFGDSDLQDETFDLVLAVRTQVAVTAMLQQFDDDDFNPADILRSVFYAPLTSGGHSKETFRAWNLNGIGGSPTGLLPEYESEIRKRIAALQYSAITDIASRKAGEDEIMQSLATEFSWFDFCVTALEWIQERKQELDVKIMRLGGATAILDTVKHEIGVDVTVVEPSPKKFDSFGSTLAEGSAKKIKSKIGSSFHQKFGQFKKKHSGIGAEQETDQSTSPGIDPPIEPVVEEAVPRSRAGPGFHQQLHRFRKSHPVVGEQTASHVEAPSSSAVEGEAIPHRGSLAASQSQRQPPADVVVVDDWAPIEDNDDDIAEPEPRRPSQAHRSKPQLSQAQMEAEERIQNYQALKKQDKENKKQSQAAKPRMFIDPQDEAERVQFDEATQVDRSQQAAPQRAGSKSRGKRPAPVEEIEDDEEVSEDEGFQNDGRVVENRSQRRLQSTTAPRRADRTNQPPPSKRARTPPRATAPSSSRAPRDPSLDYEPDEDENPPSTNHTQVKAMARQNAALARLGTGQRKRKAWTPAEERQLQCLITDHGTSWADLKRYDEDGERLLLDRDQGALKDKARNMKLAYMVARLDLPTNFQHVNLDKKGRDKLDALGIEYEQ